MPKKTQKARTLRKVKAAARPHKESNAPLTDKQKMKATASHLDSMYHIVEKDGPRAYKDSRLVISGAIAPDKILESDADFVGAMAVLDDCMYNAKRTFYNVFAKKMVVEPDYSTRMQAAKLRLAYKVGEPIKRQQILVGTVESEDQLKQKLLESPALCERVMMLVDEVKRSQQALTPTNSAQNE